MIDVSNNGIFVSEEILNRHERQIESLQKNISDVHTRVCVMSATDDHIRESLKEVSSSLKELRTGNETIQVINTKVVELSDKVHGIEKITIKNQEDIKELDIQNRKFKSVGKFIIKNPTLVIASVIIIGMFIKWVYTLDPNDTFIDNLIKSIF